MTTDGADGALWVFGYGSLMWQPGFPYDAQVSGLLNGAHRALCVYSVLHRGSFERPGLVLGLARGGACRGIAFRVTPGAEAETIEYLREREQVTDVYVEAYRTVRLLGTPRQKVRALTYLADPNHPQYAGGLTFDEQVRIVRSCCGEAGANTDYLLNTVRHLEEEGVHDAHLMKLAARLRDGT